MSIKRQFKKAKTRLKRRLGMKAPMAVVRFRPIEPVVQKQLSWWKLLLITGLFLLAIYLQYNLKG